MENKLNELNIYALRELGRRVGVSSPTSKKKEELIEAILNIQLGKKQPETTKTKQGRPPKTFGYNFNILDSNLSKISMHQDVKNYDISEVQTVAGYIELINNNSAFLWVEKNNTYFNYFVSSQVIDGLNLKTGDRVVVKVCGDENQTTVTEIYNINGCPKSKYNAKRVDYYDIENVLPNKPLVFNNAEYNSLGLKMGENTYVYGSNNNMNTCAIVDMMNACKCEYKLYVNVSIAEKNKMFLNNINNAEKLVANLTDEIDVSRRVLSLAIERAKRLIECGEDVLVVIDDLLSITSVDKDNLTFTKNLVALTKQAKKSGSITLLAVMPNNTLTQIEKLADKRLKVVDNAIISVD